MKAKERAKEKKTSAKEMEFELKYCERCGVLWVRPVGGDQIYCVACGREMADLPPASHEADGERMPRGRQWCEEEAEFEGYEEYDLGEDAAGGVA
jgi:hypothetical protein